MRFDNQIKCNGAQELVDEASVVISTGQHDSQIIDWLIKRIEAQITILTHCISHSTREDQFGIQQAISKLEDHNNKLLQKLANKEI